MDKMGEKYEKRGDHANDTQPREHFLLEVL